MHIKISWLLVKSSYQDLHCFPSSLRINCIYWNHENDLTRNPNWMCRIDLFSRMHAQTLWRFKPRDLSRYERVVAWCHVIRFLLLRYSVVCTVGSLSLFYLLFIARCVCTSRWGFDKLVIFHANQTSMCPDPHQNQVRVRLVPLNMFKPSSIFYWPFKGGASFVDLFYYLCFMFVFVMLSCRFLAALCSPVVKGLTSWLSHMSYFLVFCHFPIWRPGSGVVLDCIYSWSLPSSLHKELTIWTWPRSERRSTEVCHNMPVKGISLLD